jgi:hypothetical protein
MVWLGLFPRFPVLVHLALAATGCAPAPVQAQGGLEFEAAARFDFGRVFEGAVLTHEWRLTARGALLVRETKSDCGCTVAGLTRESAGVERPFQAGETLAPGEVLRVKASYDTRGRIGPAERTITLLTGQDGVVPLRLAADVHRWLVCEPDTLPFLRVLEGESREVAFEVRSLGGEPFGLAPTGRAIPPALTLTPTALAPDASGRSNRWRVVARLGADAPRGTHSYPLELASDVPIPGTERVHTVAPAWNLQVLGPVALSSPNLEFGLVGAGETVAKSVRLESFDPGFVLAEPRARLEALRKDEPFPLGATAQVHLHARGAAYDIEVTLAGLAPEVQGNFLARLVVETGHPRLATLEALVRGVRAPEGVSR